ncbi:MAG: hypothetical protein J6K04_01600 [Lachnospiraceae bacterium]|nr:hypothetical protein [Lachnospiraceae bacterium]MBP3567836.1 hypothetical protein [Lachnospiraceae bacterium]
MATTKNNTNKSGKTNYSGKGTRKKKKSSDDTMKFLLVLVIAAIAIALIFFSQSKENPADSKPTATPTPATAGTDTTINTPAPDAAATPTEAPEPGQDNREETPTVTPTPLATNTPMPTATPTPTNTPTPTPTPALSVTEAEKVVKDKVDTEVYDVQLVSENLVVGNGRYYQFGAIKNQEFVYPFLVVSQADGSLHFYDSTEGTVFDFSKFPLKAEATPTPTVTPAPSGVLTAKEAYEVLCTYSKDALHIAKEVKEYDAEYGDELTFIDGVDCYRINLSEFSNGKIRNRGEFYISVDGTKCYYIDSDTNEFVEAVK